ncbi:Cyclic di-GMP phosphodiesterase response regulator RpfG [Planctomycetes bacterium MalM25]|nr:Cyclic di-GMP phosphodiesterase response regulator RpfG [Planctomycetes bacterium MalM25]
MIAARTAPAVHPTPTPQTGADGGLLDRLETAFQQTFAVVDASHGALERVTADWPRVDVFRWLPLCEQVARSERVEVLEDFAPLLLLAVPVLGDEADPTKVAVTVLLTEKDPSRDAIEAAARAFGLDPAHLTVWAAGRRAWPAHAALPLAESLAETANAHRVALSTKRQLSEVSSQLLSTFEEANLLHQLAEGLTLGHSSRELAEQAAIWLSELTPCECVLASFYREDESWATVAGGSLPIDDAELSRFFDRLGDQAPRRTIILNQDRTSSPTWSYPTVRELVTAPILANGVPVGWLAAFNYLPSPGSPRSEEQFGSIEASLLTSVATLLGVHSGNRQHFKDRTAMFNSTVHALTSAIDAKDPYTCGHSDRVARVAVRLAQQLGCSDKEINALYLGGLLHDIGKIGVSDEVLQKPDKLTDEEFEEIKTHPTLGEQILRGLPELEEVLPIVLHHHESWDGGGYPGKLVGEECPKLARIAAVADAYDAMGSDRPYRKGMPIDKVDSILRNGSGQQWDPTVVDAYFAAHADIQAISRVEREPLDLDVRAWEQAREAVAAS